MAGDENQHQVFIRHLMDETTDLVTPLSFEERKMLSDGTIVKMVEGVIKRVRRKLLAMIVGLYLLTIVLVSPHETNEPLSAIDLFNTGGMVVLFALLPIRQGLRLGRLRSIRDVWAIVEAGIDSTPSQTSGGTTHEVLQHGKFTTMDM